MSTGTINLPLAGNPSWKPPVTSSSLLPASNNTVGDVRVAEDTQLIYLWDGGMWATISGGGGGSGTVTQVEVTSPNSTVSINGSPITTSGIIELDIIGDDNFFAGYDLNGNLHSVPGWAVNPDTQGGQVNLLNVSVPNDAFIINASASGIDVPGNFFAFNVFSDNTSTFSSYRAFSSGNDGAVSQNGSGVQVNQNGTVTGGWTGFGSYVNADVGDGNDNAIGVDISFQNHVISGQVFGFNFNNNSTISGPNAIYALNANNGGDGHNITGVSFNNNGDMTEEVRGIGLSSNGDARTVTILDGNFQGAITDDANGIRINLNGITSSTSVSGLTIQVGDAVTSDPQGPRGIQSDAKIEVNATNQLMSSQGFQIGNRVEVEFVIPNGSPVTGTDSLGNNFAGDLAAQDDMAAGPAGLGWNSVGFIASVGVAAGKTIDKATVFLPAMAIPDPGFTTGGTITDLGIVRIYAPVPEGGTLLVTNLYGLQVNPQFGGLGNAATNAWGVWVGDDTADNWFAKNIILGGATGKPTNSDVMLEIDSPKAFLPGRMTTTQRDAMTPVQGMVVFNTTTVKLEYFDGTVWVSL